MLRITECPRSRGSTRLGRLRFHAEICSICFLFACKSSKKKKKGNSFYEIVGWICIKCMLQKRDMVVVSSKHFHTFSYFFIRRESGIKMTFAGSLFSNTMNNLYRLWIEKRIFFFSLLKLVRTIDDLILFIRYLVVFERILKEIESFGR